jgi:hypothetical protein
MQMRIINRKMLRHIVPVVVAASPSISYAADTDGQRCTPLPRAVCIAHFTKAQCDKYRQDCEKPTVARHVPTLNNGNTENINPAVPEVTPASKQEPQQFFIRADRLDNPYPGLSASAPSVGQALGASINYTDTDFVQAAKTTNYRVSTSQSVMVSGLASYAFLDQNGDPWGVFGPNDRTVTFAPSLSVFANGSWDKPTKVFTDTSVLKVGPEFAFRFQPKGPVDDLDTTFQAYVSLAPFYQTDFYGQASAEGATLSFTPSYPALFLFAPRSDFYKYAGGLFDGFLEVRAEATYLNVGQQGATLLHQGSYEWLGGAVRSYIFFFPSYGSEYSGLDKEHYLWLVDRFSFIGTYQNYWDANSHATAEWFSAALQYKIGTCDTSPKLGQQPLKCQFGAPSVTAEYDWGKDRDTLQYTKKITLKLTYAY